MWLTAGLVVAVLAGFVAFTTLSHASGAPATQQAATGAQVAVVVTTHAVPIRAVLKTEDVAVKEVPVATVPEGAVRTVDAVVGQITLVELYAGEVILPQRLLKPNVTAADGRTALSMVEDQVLMGIPAQDILSRVDLLKPGDHVDILFSLNFPEIRGLQSGDKNKQGSSENSDKDEQTTFHVLQNVTIAEIVNTEPISDKAASVVANRPSNGNAGANAPQAIMLTLSPQDSLVLKYAMDKGGVLDLVLRAPGVDRTFDTHPVDIDYLISRYNIPIGPGQ